MTAKKKETTKVTVLNKHNLAIHKLAPKERVYYLNGIHVTDDFTEVTNGHYLVRVSTLREDMDEILNSHYGQPPTIKPVETVIKAEDAKDIERSLPKEKGLPAVDEKAWFLEQTAEKIELGAFKKGWTVEPMEGKFANTNSVWPKDTPEIELAFDAGYMETLCGFIRKAFKSNYNDPKVTLKLYGAEKPIEMKAENSDTGQTIEVLLMPVRM